MTIANQKSEIANNPPPAGHFRPIAIPAAIPRTTIPAAHPVIPAKAGIHTPPHRHAGAAGVLDSGLRRNDGGAAGMTMGAAGMAVGQME